MSLYFPLFSARLRINIFALLSLSVMLYAEGIAVFSILFAAAILHEVGHLLCLRLFAARVDELRIEPFGAAIQYDPTALTLREETAVSLSGILFNILFAFIGATALQFTQSIYLLLFIFANLFFAFVNLIPINGNDGSNAIFYAALMRYEPQKAEKIMKTAAFIGRLVLLALMIFIVVLSNFNNSLFAIAVLLCLPR